MRCITWCCLSAITNCWASISRILSWRCCCWLCSTVCCCKTSWYCSVNVANRCWVCCCSDCTASICVSESCSAAKDCWLLVCSALIIVVNVWSAWWAISSSALDATTDGNASIDCCTGWACIRCWLASCNWFNKRWLCACKCCKCSLSCCWLFVSACSSSNNCCNRQLMSSSRCLAIANCCSVSSGV